MMIRRLLTGLFSALLLCGLLLSACGGASDGSRTTPVASQPGATTTSTSPSHRRFTQATAPALAACRRAVARPVALSASTRQEISALCDRINDVIEDNEATVRAVCQELASAVPAPNASDRKRRFADCYAEYAKTIK
jgi:hypothetical protein